MKCRPCVYPYTSCSPEWSITLHYREALRRLVRTNAECLQLLEMFYVLCSTNHSQKRCIIQIVTIIKIMQRGRQSEITFNILRTTPKIKISNESFWGGVAKIIAISFFPPKQVKRSRLEATLFRNHLLNVNRLHLTFCEPDVERFREDRLKVLLGPLGSMLKTFWL